MDRAQEGVVPGLERVMATLSRHPRRRAWRSSSVDSRYEILPLDGVEEQVLEHVPRDVTLTVTASPTKGLEPHARLAGLARAARLRGRAAPLRAARGGHAPSSSRSSRGCARPSVRDVFVVAGDAEEPRGAFHGAIDLLEALDELGRPFAEVGITGYPESHPLIDDETTIAAMFEKARHATYIASQVCFDPADHRRSGSRTSGRGGRSCRSTSASPGRCRGEAPPRVDPDRDRRLAPVPAEERQLRGSLPPRAASAPTR